MAEMKDRADCPNIEVNEVDCTCTADCDLQGKCCACIQAHRQNDDLPACLA